MFTGVNLGLRAMNILRTIIASFTCHQHVLWRQTEYQKMWTNKTVFYYALTLLHRLYMQSIPQILEALKNVNEYRRQILHKHHGNWIYYLTRKDDIHSVVYCRKCIMTMPIRSCTNWHKAGNIFSILILVTLKDVYIGTRHWLATTGWTASNIVTVS